MDESLKPDIYLLLFNEKFGYNHLDSNVIQYKLITVTPSLICREHVYKLGRSINSITRTLRYYGRDTTCIVIPYTTFI